MNGEKKIIIAGVVVLVFGISKAALDKKPLDVPLIGGLSFILLLSLLSAFSESLSDLAGNFALLGMATVLLIDGPEVIGQVNGKIGINSSQQMLATSTTAPIGTKTSSNVFGG